jgi:hypothetical protein
MIRVEDDLPEAALLDGAAADLAAPMAAAGGLWLHGEARHFRLGAEGVILGWQTTDGRAEAVPTKPNEGHGRRALTDTGCGLQCRTGVHCGLVLPHVLDRVERFSMAVLYRADPGVEARTLLTVNGEGEGGSAPYFFLADYGDSYLAKDTSEGLSLAAGKTPGVQGLRCVLVTLDRGRIALQDSGGPVQLGEGIPPALPMPASLFVGVRSHRGGLQKTLGEAVIEDVLIWPGMSLLLPQTDADEAQRLKLARYFLWRR